MNPERERIERVYANLVRKAEEATDKQMRQAWLDMANQLVISLNLMR